MSQDDFRVKIPEFLRHALSRGIYKHQAKQVWHWVEGNSNTVIVDDIEAALRERRDWKDSDESE